MRRQIIRIFSQYLMTLKMRYLSLEFIRGFFRIRSKKMVKKKLLSHLNFALEMSLMWIISMIISEYDECIKIFIAPKKNITSQHKPLKFIWFWWHWNWGFLDLVGTQWKFRKNVKALNAKCLIKISGKVSNIKAFILTVIFSSSLGISKFAKQPHANRFVLVAPQHF